MPGKTDRSRSFAYFSRHRIKPDRGPRSVLCVVDVTKSACGTGLGGRPTATRPAIGAQSTTNGPATAGEVGNVHDDRRAEGRGDGGDAGEVDDAWIGARAHHDHLRRVLMREP